MMYKILATAAVILALITILAGCSPAATQSPTFTTATPATTTAQPLTPTSASPLPGTTARVTTTPPATSPKTTTTAKTTAPTITTMPSSVPAEYQSLYTQLQTYLNDADKLVSAAWDGSSYPVGYSAELLTADANAGPGILQTSTQKVMFDELQAEADMGMKAITVQIGFPILDVNFYIFQGETAAQAQQSVQAWLDYYKSIVQAAHNLGLKFNVESNPLLTYYLAADSPLNPGNYYKTLDFATYQARRSQHNIMLAKEIKPDYLLLQTEPDTDAVDDYRTELYNGTKDAAMIKQFVTDLENANIPGLHTTIQLGSGCGAWISGWKTYISGLVAIPGLDKLDTHVYNIQPDINQVGEFAVAMQIADIAHAAGKGVSISELWCHKSVVLSGFNEGSDSLVDIRVRDTFSFWQPLDAQFFNIMAKLAVGKHFDYISGFGHYDWFTEIDYSGLKATPVFPIINKGQNDTLDASITAMQNQNFKLALADHQLSPTGKVYQALIKNGPAR